MLSSRPQSWFSTEICSTITIVPAGTAQGLLKAFRLSTNPQTMAEFPRRFLQPAGHAPNALILWFKMHPPHHFLPPSPAKASTSFHCFSPTRLGSLGCPICVFSGRLTQHAQAAPNPRLLPGLPAPNSIRKQCHELVFHLCPKMKGPPILSRSLKIGQTLPCLLSLQEGRGMAEMTL